MALASGVDGAKLPTMSNHFDESGRARMVDVSAKPTTRRSATATATVRMSAAAVAAIRDKTARKGDVLAVARLAGIMAAKQTATLIPLCHSIPIESVSVDFNWEVDIMSESEISARTALAVERGIDPDDESLSEMPGLHVDATVATTGKTGVEMEAMTAASVAALTVYDMLKSIDKSICIQQIKLLRKSGGKSGDYQS